MSLSPSTGNAANAIVAFFCVNLYFILALGSETFSLSIFADDGAISILTICVLLVGQLFVLYEFAAAAKLNHRFDWLLLAYVLQVYIMREADFHQTFTASNVTKTSFYTQADNPLHIKLIAGIVLILCFLAVFYLAAKYAMVCIKALRNRTPWAVAALLWFSMLFLSQVFGKSALIDAEDLRV